MPAKPARRLDLFGGKGEVIVTDLLAGEAVAAPFTTVLACQLAPGGSVGTHVQQEDAEIVVVLEGEGVATVAGSARPLTPGVVVSLPHGHALALENRSATEPLHYLIVKARPPNA